MGREKDEGQEAETGPQTAQPEPTMPSVDSTVAAPQPVASGPSVQLMHEQDDGDPVDLGNLRIETVHCAGEACGLDKLGKKDMDAEQGNVVIVGTGVPRPGADLTLSGAVGSRGRLPFTLQRNDGDGKLSGEFVVSRMSPAGVVNGEQTYNVVLENAGPKPKED